MHGYCKWTKGKGLTMKNQAFINFIETVAEKVSLWPDWKRNQLGYIPPHTDLEAPQHETD